MPAIRDKFKSILGKVVDVVLDYPTEFGGEGNNSSFVYIDVESSSFEPSTNKMLLQTITVALYVHTIGADANGSRMALHEQIVTDVCSACLQSMNLGLSGIVQDIIPVSIQANTTVIAAELREAQSAFQASKVTLELLTTNTR